MRAFTSAFFGTIFLGSALAAAPENTLGYRLGTPSRLIVQGGEVPAGDAATWTKRATVVVASGTPEEIQRRPAMLGTWKIDGTKPTFEPKFPLVEGVTYRVTYHDPEAKTPVVWEVTIPRTVREPSAKILQVYPTRNLLPENQLKFYVQFSAPMSREEIYSHIRLLNDQGKAIELPFLEIDEQLWNPAGDRVTLLFDPGRVKRGLKPREELGPILEEGKNYTLTIAKDWKDANGTIMQEAFRKTFKVSAPENQPPDPKTWKIEAPASKTRNPVQLRFPKPMDHALLNRVVWIVDADGKRVAGTVSVHEEETVWRLTPQNGWAAGNYQIVVDTVLEDLAANRIGNPFEVDPLREALNPQPPKQVKLPFKVE